MMSSLYLLQKQKDNKIIELENKELRGNKTKIIIDTKVSAYLLDKNQIKLIMALNGLN